jgi:Ca2+-transporting ATPase
MESDKLAPPTLQVNTRQRALSNTDTIASSTSNPFLTPTLTPTSPSSTSNLLPSSNASTIIEVPQALLVPDPGTEADFEVDDNPFAFSPGQLNKLLNPKSLSAFQALGGVEGIATGLQSDPHSGLSVDEAAAPRQISFDEAVNRHTPIHSKESDRTGTDAQPFQDRIRVYGRNALPPKKATPLWKLIWGAYK